MTLPTNLLMRSPHEATRRIALELLDEAHLASERIGAAADDDALHDFRVAIRRLRSHGRSHERHLRGALGRKRRRQLRDLQRATGGARDLEVKLAWVEKLSAQLTDADRVGLGALKARLAERRVEAGASVDGTTLSRFARLEERLRRSLDVVRVRLTDPETSFGEVLALRATEQLAELRERLALVQSVADDEAIHEARIAGKQLRYLLEPARSDGSKHDGSKKSVAELKALQDVLGDLHDMHVLGDEVRTSLDTASDDERVALDGLMRVIVAHGEGLFAELGARWLRDGAAEIAVRVEAFVAELSRRDVEVERKLLLSLLPPHATEHSSVEIAQGYVPGEAIHERLRSITSGDEVRHVRTVKLGRGVQRQEFEESTSAAVFRAMWPLTAGARVVKRRYHVPEGAHEWVVDEFLDRPLVLAEIELRSPDEAISVPAWLAPFVVRDVTDEAEYVNLNLAR